MSPAFSQRLLDWFEQSGRHDLPWQQQPTAYGVWVSEIMLQQTRVGTVIPYYQRFMQDFPELTDLASAAQDQVLHRWSGLGYYARARNLHRAAQLVVQHHQGKLPEDLDALQQLPGIGRSTAGAILCFTAGQRHAILDGNVKRVLCRHQAVEGWPGATPVQKRLWELAEQFTPGQRVAEYTQAIMDLGATLCVRGRPDCEQCPVNGDCMARSTQRQLELPAPKPKRKLPVRQVTFMILRNAQGQVLLRKRPPSGVWGGLWGFPECAPEEALETCCRRQLGLQIGQPAPWPSLRHTFSHFHLDIQPTLAEVAKSTATLQDAPETRWVHPDDCPALGLAAPVARLLNQLRTQS